jgi:hypothetical protein
MAHGKEVSHGKEWEQRTAKILGRQSPCKPHGKETAHGKGLGTAVQPNFAVQTDKLHGKGSFAVRFSLCRAPIYIFFVFLTILFHLLLIFILLISFSF